MNAKIQQEIEELTERIRAGLALKEAMDERITIRRCLSLATSNEEFAACMKARFSVEDAVMKAISKANTQSPTSASVEDQSSGCTHPQTQQKFKFNVNAKVFISGRQLKKAKDVEERMKSEVDALEVALKSTDGQLGSLRTELQISQKKGEHMAEQTAKVLEENVKLSHELEELKKQAELDTAKLENCEMECSELANKWFIVNTITEKKQSQEPVLPLVAELPNPSVDYMDLIYKLDSLEFRGNH